MIMKTVNLIALIIYVYAISCNSVMSEKVCEICAKQCSNSSDSPFSKYINLFIEKMVNWKLTENRAEQKLTENKILKLLGKCTVRYNDVCTWGFFVGGKQVNYETAFDLCDNEGGRMAGVYSDEHYNQLIMYALPYAVAKMDGNFWMWTGMTYQNAKVANRNGTWNATRKWSKGFPRKNGDKIGIIVNVDRQLEGIVNFPGSEIYGVFCEIDI